MQLRPVRLYLNENVLHIDWNDGTTTRHSSIVLRRRCPCAGCQGHNAHQAVPAEVPNVDPEVRIVRVAPAGNYGYHIDFSDGHGTGIYTLELLRALGTLESQP